MSLVQNLQQQAPNRENVCAVVVSYFPQGDFLFRLKQIRSQVAQVAVVDNASSEETLSLLEAAQSELGVAVIRNQTNLGIATALNQGARFAREKGYAWCLLFDQDTTPSSCMRQRLAEVYAKFPRKNRLAVLGSNYRGAGSGETTVPDSELWIERKTVITSGSLVSLAALERIGPFRDEFFMDCVDFDFCLRARSMGFEVVEAIESVMEHFIGAPTKHRLLWSQRNVFNHSPFRWYYKTRNNMVLCGEYLRKDPAWVIRAVCARILESLLMLLFEKSRLPKVKYMTAGLRDGVVGRLGKIAG
jgi:rhamnosyltransferase